MNYLLHLPEIPFRAIKNGTKKVEGRVYRQTTKYHEMRSGDIITFVNEDTDEKMDVNVLYVHHYPDTKTMLETEEIKNVCSGRETTMEESIERYNCYTHYRENIPKYGIYAIGVKPINSNP